MHIDVSFFYRIWQKKINKKGLFEIQKWIKIITKKLCRLLLIRRRNLNSTRHSLPCLVFCARRCLHSGSKSNSWLPAIANLCLCGIFSREKWTTQYFAVFIEHTQITNPFVEINNFFLLYTTGEVTGMNENITVGNIEFYEWSQWMRIAHTYYSQSVCFVAFLNSVVLLWFFIKPCVCEISLHAAVGSWVKEWISISIWASESDLLSQFKVTQITSQQRVPLRFVYTTNTHLFIWSVVNAQFKNCA